MKYPDTETLDWQAEEISRLREEVEQERERRILTALWGSREEDCPRAFSIYQPAPEAEAVGDGILGYGCTFADGFTVVRRTDFDGAPRVDQYLTFGELENEVRPRGARVVWLSEDLDDFTAAVTESVEHNFKMRAQADSVRITVSHAISAAVGDFLPWSDCCRVADRVLTALFGVDES